MSLKCMIDKWLHKGQISQEEYDAVIKKLDGHDAEIKGQTIRDVLETVKEQNEIYLAEREKQIRADAIKEYKQELKQDINSRLKSVEKYLEGETLDAWRQATRTFKDAIDYFSEQLKEKK